MADIKWIKITTDIFDDEKIKIIDTMPARDEIIVIWFKLLSLAGKVNQNGLLFMNNKIAYTPEMLAAIFNRKLNTVTLALNTFEGFGMIDIEDNNVIGIANWEKHQNIDGMDKIREQNKLRQQKHRAKKELKLVSNVTSRDSNAVDKEKEENKIKKKSNKKDITEKKLSFHDFDLVKLTQKEYDTCITNYGEDQTIKALDKLNSFIGSSGKKYKSHYHTLATWVWDSVKAVKLSEVKKQNDTICEVF